LENHIFKHEEKRLKFVLKVFTLSSTADYKHARGEYRKVFSFFNLFKEKRYTCYTLKLNWFGTLISFIKKYIFLPIIHR